MEGRPAMILRIDQVVEVESCLSIEGQIDEFEINFLLDRQPMKRL